MYVCIMLFSACVQQKSPKSFVDRLKLNTLPIGRLDRVEFSADLGAFRGASLHCEEQFWLHFQNFIERPSGWLFTAICCLFHSHSHFNSCICLCSRQIKMQLAPTLPNEATNGLELCTTGLPIGK